MNPFRFEVLAKQDRSAFDCGVEVLNRFLQTRAGQEQRKSFSVCYLLIQQETNEIAGYYTLSSTSFPINELPHSLSRKLPRYATVPAARVGRLAVDKRFRNKGLGGLLVADAVKRSTRSELGVFAIVVDAKDADAVAFYEYFGFSTFEATPDVLYLPLSARGLK